MNFKSVIRSVGHYLPPKVVTNHDLTKLMDTSDSWIVERTGIRERRYVEPGTPTSDLARQASAEALQRGNLQPGDIDYIIGATLSPDYFFPGFGVVLQQKLEMKNIPALDIRVQCTGFIYGLSVADALIRTGQAKRVLLACAEVQSPALNFTTAGRDMAVIFGDGAASVVIEAQAENESGGRPTAHNSSRGIIDSMVGADGSGATTLAMLKPGTATPGFINKSDLDSADIHPRMEGKVVFKHAVSRMCETAAQICARNGIAPKDIAMLFPHQANLRINEMVRDKLGLAPERVFNNIDRYGNTTAATIPIALSEASAQGKIKPGDLCMSLAFGAGFTWGANLFRW